VTALVRWSTGGEARIVAIGADSISLDSTVPSPPGSRIEGTLAQGARVRIKVHASKRQPDGRFAIEGRPLDLSRETRALLEGALVTK
jgi:hypothetical protein